MDSIMFFKNAPHNALELIPKHYKSGAENVNNWHDTLLSNFKNGQPSFAIAKLTDNIRGFFKNS